jgi:hypothetical protein
MFHKNIISNKFDLFWTGQLQFSYTLLRFHPVSLSLSNVLYNKHITIVNDDYIMMLQVVASDMIVILKTLEVSFMLLANIYSRGITHDDRHVTIVINL